MVDWEGLIREFVAAERAYNADRWSPGWAERHTRLDHARKAIMDAIGEE